MEIAGSEWISVQVRIDLDEGSDGRTGMRIFGADRTSTEIFIIKWINIFKKKL